MIYLGSDHGGYELKHSIGLWLRDWGHPFEDLGPTTLEPLDDYPDFAFAVAKSVIADPSNRGILACRSAAGMVMAANRLKGIRAFAAFDQSSVKHARDHQDANIMALGADWMSEEHAKELTELFLRYPFSGEERHLRRIAKLDSL